MYCNHCGKKLIEDSKFCCYCGSKVNDNENLDNEQFDLKFKANPVIKSYLKFIIPSVFIVVFFILILFDKDNKASAVNNSEKESDVSSSESAKSLSSNLMSLNDIQGTWRYYKINEMIITFKVYGDNVTINFNDQNEIQFKACIEAELCNTGYIYNLDEPEYEPIYVIDNVNKLKLFLDGKDGKSYVFEKYQ